MTEVTLVCPECRADLVAVSHAHKCTRCNSTWPFAHGFPKLFREAEVRGSDRFMRLFYNGLPALHDPLTHHLLPWLQRDSSEAELREATLASLDLESLRPRSDGAPVQILEVGIGAGANLPFVAARLPRGVRAVYFGLDLSHGMLRHCRKRSPHASLDVRLLLGDAHRLPFKDQVFDRVFHVGAIASFGAPELALAEMGRVAKADTPIVVVDEQLDRARRNTLRDHLAFRLLTFYDRNPHCPKELLPPEAAGVHETQITRFYYKLTFSMPPSSKPQASAPTLNTSAP